MADNRRVMRIADAVKRALGNIIETKLEDPHKGFITITRVKMSPDLRIATVYYTVLGEDEQKAATKAVFTRSKSFLKNEIKPYITSRWLPDLRFFFDETMDEAQHINELLKKIEHDTHSGPE